MTWNIKHTASAALTAMLLSCMPAAAQEFPNQEIRIIVPWNPGGSTDIMARKILPILEKDGVKAIVENLPGGGSAVGMGQVATAKPDGYTVGLGSSSILSLIAQKTVPFDHQAFTDLVQFSEDPLILVVSAKSEWKTPKDFITHMKDNPGSVTIGTPGTNNVNHAMAGMTGRVAGVEFRHIPYPGGSRVIAEILGGQINAGVLKPSETIPQIQAGELRAVGVYRNDRIESLPDTETFKEAGYDVLAAGDLAQITYLAAPAGLPAEIKNSLIGIFEKAVKSDEFQSFAKENGFLAGGRTGDELTAYNEELVGTLKSAASEIFVEK